MDNLCPMNNVVCCSCGCKLVAGVGLNFVVTSKRATWKCPVFGGLDIPDCPARAIAIICDACDRGNVPPVDCVEFLDNGLVKYHELEKLEEVVQAEFKMKYYFGKKMGFSSAVRNRLMLKAARERSVN